MSYLLYCILDGHRQEPRRKLRFLGYPKTSIMVRAAGLGAAVSRTSSADTAPDVARLLVYSKIVEWFNDDYTVIPMRYGCTFRELGEITKFLEDHKRQYLQLLDELNGRVEMSARITLPELGLSAPSRASEHSHFRARFAGRGASPGIAYLAERFSHYSLCRQSEKRLDEIRGEICSRAQGTFVQSTSEYRAADGKAVLSAHFLVPREQVCKFKQALAPLSAGSTALLAVTGPWPPYNFVLSSPARPPTSPSHVQ